MVVRTASDPNAAEAAKKLQMAVINCIHSLPPLLPLPRPPCHALLSRHWRQLVRAIIVNTEIAVVVAATAAAATHLCVSLYWVHLIAHKQVIMQFHSEVAESF